MYIEFAIDIAGVDLDRVQREEQPGSDFLIAQPFGDELEYFSLSSVVLPKPAGAETRVIRWPRRSPSSSRFTRRGRSTEPGTGPQHRAQGPVFARDLRRGLGHHRWRGHHPSRR
jgi:hypothetical protein